MNMTRLHAEIARQILLDAAFWAVATKSPDPKKIKQALEQLTPAETKILQSQIETYCPNFLGNLAN